jgi:aminoglycoside phosphotransferase (APT) family kinase protein
MSAVEIVETAAEAEGLDLAPLLVLQPLEKFLDARGLGAGKIVARRIGEGHSNVTYLVERGGERFVLRRPPRPPLPPSAHDMLREARVQQALEQAGARVPHVLAVCEDESVLGVPFYLMAYLEGVVVTERLPAALDRPEERRRIGIELVEALAEIHAVDRVACGLGDFGRPDGYLERQVRRFAGLWEINATRDLPQVGELAEWLQANRPESVAASVVHGEYRLGNVMLSRSAPARLLAVIDWELATIGDPLADVGYLVATYADADSPGTALELSPVTRAEGFPSRAELAELYEQRTGRAVGALPWYEALALWKAAVFCEAIYGRYLRGELGRDDAFGASLAGGVPRLLETAQETASR